MSSTKTAKSRAGGAMFLAGAVLLTASCSSIPYFSKSDASATQAAEDFRQERANALLDYVELERAKLPEVLAAMPGLYSEVRVEGTFELQDGSRGPQAGEYAVVWFHYTYAQEMDWSSILASLDAQRPALEQLCTNTVLPAMKAAGVDGPRSAVWSYYDSRSAYGAMWTHSCSEWESTAQE